MNITKTISILALGALLALGSSFVAGSKAKASQPPPAREAIVLTGYETGSFPNSTLKVYSASGPSAQLTPSGTSLGDAISIYLNAGFHVEHVGPGPLFLLVK